MASNKRDAAAGSKSEAPKKTQLQRHPGLYVFSVFILVLIVVTFIGAPALRNTQSRGKLLFGRYGNKDISYQPGNYFARQYDAIAQSLRDSGEGANLELQLRLAWREAFNRTVLNTAILDSAADAGVQVTENKVDELLAVSPRFQENGRFSPDLYNRLSAQERYSTRKFYRETQIFQQVVQDVLSGGKISDAESAFVKQMATPERAMRIVRFPFSDYPEDELLAFARENPTIFTTLELEVITLANENEVDQIRDQAVTGSSFSDLARTYSRDVYADQGGSVGRIMAYELERLLKNPDDLSTLLSLRNGEVSEKLEVVGGWAFYRAVADPQPIDLEADDTVATVREYVEVYEQGRVQDFARNRADAFAETARSSSFSAAASTEDLQIYETSPFAINYGNEPMFSRVQSDDIPDLADAAFQDTFFQTAFSLNAGETSDPVVLRDSVIVMELGSEQEVPEDSLGFVETYYPYLKQQFMSDQIEAVFVDRDLLEDNFNQSFSRYVLGNG